MLPYGRLSWPRQYRRMAAGKVGGEWRDTGKIIKKAEEAAAAGNSAAAEKMAKKA